MFGLHRAAGHACVGGADDELSSQGSAARITTIDFLRDERPDSRPTSAFGKRPGSRCADRSCEARAESGTGTSLSWSKKVKRLVVHPGNPRFLSNRSLAPI